MGVALIPGLPTIGGPEMIIALVIILLLFGAKKIPELARGLGSGVREFRAGQKDGELQDQKKKEEELKDGEDEAVTNDASAESENASTNGSTDTHVREDAPVDADKAEQQSR